METIRVNVTQDDPIGVQMEYTTNYNKLTNKPQINGVTLVGNKTTQDLHIETGTENWELIKSGSIQSGEYVNGILINKDNNGNDFVISKFILYVWNMSRQDASTSYYAGNIEINNTQMLTGNCYISPNKILKIQAEYIGVGYSNWNFLTVVDMGTGNTITYRSQRIKDEALNVGVCSSIKIGSTSTSAKMYFDYCLVGVKYASQS